ncbi:MAG: hypothetical protein JOS17DRAFT_819004 [Linnemannia elongata]|nr:MAG: hypothetical protein JOS17DRAFT_819004 [Linnemannia elongata]
MLAGDSWLAKKSLVPSRHCANLEISHHVTCKWHIPEEDTLATFGTCSGIDNLVHLKTSEDGSSPDKLVFDCSRNRFQYNRIFRDLGSPLPLYRLCCTFPSAVQLEPSDKSSWWSALTHKATGNIF